LVQAMRSPHTRKICARRPLRFLLLALVSVVALGNVVKIVVADIPDVLQVEDISQGSTGRIRLQVRHLNPSGTHYVDTIEVDIDGQIKKFTLQAQSTNPFTVELDLGQFQGRPNVKARTHCTLHGWGPWSNQIQIPEFAEAGTTLLLAMAASLLIARKGKKK